MDAELPGDHLLCLSIQDRPEKLWARCSMRFHGV